MSEAEGAETCSSSKLPARVTIDENEYDTLSLNEWGTRWKQQDLYISSMEHKLSQQEGELLELKQSQERTRNQLNESQLKERILIRRLAAKEQESQDLVLQLNEFKNSQVPNTSALRSALIDPAVNLLIQRLRDELLSTRSKLEDTQNELAAWKFTPDSNTGKRLMAKCRLLYQENEELGKLTSSGRIAKLESDLALQKSFAEEVRKSQNELDSFLADLDEDVEGMQSTILFLQQELKKSKDNNQVLQKEINNLKLLINNHGRSNGDNNLTSVVVNNCEQQERTDSSDATTDFEHDTNNIERTRVKRVRRSSVLSIDYNEDDALVLTTNGDVAMSSDPE